MVHLDQVRAGLGDGPGDQVRADLGDGRRDELDLPVLPHVLVLHSSQANGGMLSRVGVVLIRGR